MPDPYMIDDDRGTDLSARRTGLAFQRTRMAADRTMMAVIRTSLSLISFGFTIYKVIEGIRRSTDEVGDHAARNFGVTLILIGMATLIGGIVYQARFMHQMRVHRAELESQGSIHAETQFPYSFNLLLAIVLFLVGLVAVFSMVFRIGPF